MYLEENQRFIIVSNIILRCLQLKYLIMLYCILQLPSHRNIYYISVHTFKQEKPTYYVTIMVP